MVLRFGTSVTPWPIASDGKQDEHYFTKKKPEGTHEMKKKKTGAESAAEP